MPQPGRVPARVAEIHRIFGDVDDAVITTIIAMGATEAELLEAAQWMRADDQLGISLGHGPEGLVSELCELLRAEEPEEDR